MSDKSLTRRELLARGAGAVLAASATAATGYVLHDPSGDAGLAHRSLDEARLKNYFGDVEFPASAPRISVATGAIEQTEQLVRAAVSGLDPSRGMSRFISKGDVVLIKPNIGFDRPPHLGATTDPEVLRWVIRLCKEAGAGKVVVTDNPIESPDACFARSGIGHVAASEGAELMMPAEPRFRNLLLRDQPPDPTRGEVLGRWPVFYDPLAGADKVIGVAPVKDHNLCGASMNLKNWYGLLGGRRNQFHQAIHDIISDLGLIISPTLVVADATKVMMTNGPTGGRTSDTRPGGELGTPAVIASVDPVACDAWCYRHLLGRDPAGLSYLRLANEKIARQIETGSMRFGECDWRTYHRQDKIAISSV